MCTTCLHIGQVKGSTMGFTHFRPGLDDPLELYLGTPGVLKSAPVRAVPGIPLLMAQYLFPVCSQIDLALMPIGVGICYETVNLGAELSYPPLRQGEGTALRVLGGGKETHPCKFKRVDLVLQSGHGEAEYHHTYHALIGIDPQTELIAPWRIPEIMVGPHKVVCLPAGYGTYPVG